MLVRQHNLNLKQLSEGHDDPSLLYCNPITEPIELHRFMKKLQKHWPGHTECFGLDLDEMDIETRQHIMSANQRKHDRIIDAHWWRREDGVEKI